MSCCSLYSPLFRKPVIEKHHSPEASTFQRYYRSLELAIQNPETLANILFAKQIIHCHVKDQIQVPTQTHSQKCNLLLNAVERTIIADPQKFHVLAEVLQEEHPTGYIAQQLLKSK